jgi:hypothetical protein
MKILIATVLVGWKCEKNEHLDWLIDKDQIKKDFPDSKFFAALEIDVKGIDPFIDVLRELGMVGGEYWTYGINDHVKKVGSQNRWIRIETGRNLIREYAQRNTWQEDSSQQLLDPIVEYDAILFIDSDIRLTSEIIKQMIECNKDVVSINFPYYGGASIACMMIKSPLYFDLPFYHNSYEKINDDFRFQNEIKRRGFDINTIDNIIIDTPSAEIPVEARQIPDRML